MKLPLLLIFIVATTTLWPFGPKFSFAARISKSSKLEYSNVSDGEILTLKCPYGHILHIHEAEVRASKDRRARRFRTCHSDDLTVRHKCEGYKSCSVHADRSLLRKNCLYNIHLGVYFSCLQCKKRTRDELRRKRSGRFVCNLTERLNPHKIQTSCPNNRFVQKHVSSNTNTNLGASMFAAQAANVRNYGATSTTNLQTVFMAQTVTYSYNHADNTCTFVQRVPKYNCRPTQQNIWHCTFMGNVRATHSLATGHYDQMLDTV